MPDVLTHLLLGIALVLFLGTKTKEEAVFIILGSIIIDIERPFTILMDNLNLDLFKLTTVFHSILGATCLSLAAASCFENCDKVYWRRFRLIFIGSIWHLIVDITMYPWEEIGIYLLYPLQITSSFNLFWPSFTGYPIMAIIICLIALLWFFVIKSLKSVIYSPSKLT